MTVARDLRAAGARGTRAAFDVRAIREDFPVLHQTVFGKPLVYLDNAATAQKPRAVIDAITRFYTLDNSNIHRGLHALSERATAAYEESRAKARRFLHAAEDREIIFVRGTTEAINLVAHSYGRPHLGAGDEVLITAMEHHSNIVPWQILCEEKGARLRIAPIDDSGALRLDEFERLLTERTRIVSVPHVSNALGTINPVRRIVEMAQSWSTAPRRRRTSRSTCGSWGAISTRCRGTKCSAPPGSASCTAGRTFWKRCLPTRGAAT